MKDVFGLGKVLPIDKLIEIVASISGKLSKPYFDRKDIETKVYEIKKLAEARAEELKIVSNAVRQNASIDTVIEFKNENISVSQRWVDSSRLPDLPLSERSDERVKNHEMKRQLNTENITALAALELKNEQPVSNEPFDEDWKTRFFNIAGDVSNEEMQILWAKILAGEIKRPKSYSLRTLEILKNLSRDEADNYENNFIHNAFHVIPICILTNCNRGGINS